MSKIVMPKLTLDPVQLRRGPFSRQSPFGPRQFADRSQATPLNQASPAPRGKRMQHDVPPEYVGDPIHLTGAVAGLPSGAQGAAVNVKALKNPGPGPVEIFGLKFRLRSSGLIPCGGLVACRLDLGDFHLTNGFIPVYAFGRAENVTLEQLASTSGIGTTTTGYAEYICRLSRPIYLPPGAAIRPQLQHKGQSNAAVDVQVSMFGRMLDADTPLPENLKLPYWAAYTCKTFTLGAADSDTSAEADLINPFDVPLEMERFVGRINYFSGTGFTFGAAMSDLEQSLTLVPVAASPTAYIGQLSDALGQITCSIVDSNGYPVVKRLTPFRLVFDAETRSWPVTHDLPAGAYYSVSMANSAWLVSDPFAGISVFAQPCISMLGWREVA